MKSKTLTKDFNELLHCGFDWKEFKDKSFLITGATGLVGSLLTKFLLYLNNVKKLNIKITGLIRNKQKAEKLYTGYTSNENLYFLVHNLGNGEIQTNQKFDYIIHAASITNSKMMITKPVETVKTSVNGTEEVLDLAIKSGTKRMVYISSMEAYGQPLINDKIKENNLGYLDLTNPRSGYPESKRLCEVLCSSYVSEFGLNVCSARFAQTFGAGILPTESRVFAQFARSILKNENIILHTQGNSEGNYVYSTDMIKATLFLLLHGQAGEAYNVTNENNHVTIKQMAQLVVDNFGNGKSKVKIEIPDENMGYAPDVKMALSSEKINQLGWKAKIDLVEMYRRLIEYLKETEFANLDN